MSFWVEAGGPGSEGGAPAAAAAEPAAAAAETPDGGVRWDLVIFPLGNPPDGLDCDAPLVAAAAGGAQSNFTQSQYQAAGQPWFCDEAVPEEKVRPAVEAADAAR